jgi:copper chaperone CopZ
MLKGMSPGAAIVFLMAGPATNAATITIIGKVFGRRTLILYLVSIIAGALFFGILVNELLPREWFTAPLQHFHKEQHEHGLLPNWLHVFSSILLSLLILNALTRKYGKKLLSSFTKTSPTTSNINLNMKDLHIIVKGMTCNHCKETVEQNVGKLPGISGVEADLTSGKVHLSGENFNLTEIQRIIESLGYKYKGLAK